MDLGDLIFGLKPMGISVSQAISKNAVTLLTSYKSDTCSRSQDGIRKDAPHTPDQELAGAATRRGRTVADAVYEDLNWSDGRDLILVFPSQIERHLRIFAMPLSLSQRWRHDPMLKAIMFEAGIAEETPQQMGIKVDALADISKSDSTPPEAMGQLYLDNHARIEEVASAILIRGRRRHRGITMLFPEDFV